MPQPTLPTPQPAKRGILGAIFGGFKAWLNCGTGCACSAQGHDHKHDHGHTHDHAKGGCGCKH